jgi:hypothetical protein
VKLVAVMAMLLAQGIATRNIKPQPRPKSSGLPWHAKFTDIAKQAGLTAPTIYGGDRVDYILETSSGGVGLLDYDGDGWMDIVLVSGTRLDDPPPESSIKLYRNRGDATFDDVTEKAGLSRRGWGSGVTVADVDADGRPDLLITFFGELALYRNVDGARFEDVAASSGLPAKSAHWHSGATFLDYDRDGDLDLFISNYVDFDLQKVPRPGENPNCNWKGLPVACGPRGLPAPRPMLFRNDRGKFVDVSAKSGVGAASGSFGMTAIAADLNRDGWPDIYVACDSTPSFLFVNQKDGTFTEEGIERGVALNEDGREQAGMGIAIGDYNLDGRLDLFKTHFADDTHVLYRNEGDGNFTDVTVAAGLAVETRYVAWGTAMADFDNDGWPDLLLATGGVYPLSDRELPGYPYRSPRLLFRNLGNGRFEQITTEAGEALAEPHSSRGLAVGDLDNDGDLDVVIWNRNEPPSLLRNDLENENRWIRFVAPLGTRVTAIYGGKRQTQVVLSQASFYSANDPRLHFGLGAAANVDIEIEWPDGAREKRNNLASNREWVLARK